jgi:hypothetical protein
MTIKEKLNQTLRHIHHAQGFLQGVGANTADDMVKQTALALLDSAEIQVIRLRKLNEADNA